MSEEIRPNYAEIEFLNLSYNKFYDIYEEVFEGIYWDKEPYYRFSKIKSAFAIYGELMNYEPIKWVIEEMKTKRPPMEAEIGSRLFKCIRNIFAHFPFYDSWDEVWINKPIVNWFKNSQTIDKFFQKYSGKPEIKYRIWEEKIKKMTYLSITFPTKYNDERIYLKDILSEKEGVKFSLILMRKIIDTCVKK